MYRKVVASISRKAFLAAGIAITSTDSLFVHFSYVTQITISFIFVVLAFLKDCACVQFCKLVNDNSLDLLPR